MYQGGLSTLNWRTMTVRMTNSVNPETVWDLLLQLNPYRSMGPDRIKQRILKELTDAITKPLAMLFNWYWKSTEVPADWKLANSLVIFRKDKKNDPGNYRPVTLTSVPGKVMEKVILRGNEKHLKDNSHRSQPAQLHERKVLLIKPGFLL
ncbi:hypothetical protein DUI87_06016 [Hirundo rustica rustica]|uniref:Reverse transcriptase domain-containing protein n=1 Tax=Hirundo rustica rustica TaxID=333673 RepID=A0A3M0L0X7_HIRRU|nr:hypothetical protein DUI87_06016 [Hirundo rustica rustica]